MIVANCAPVISTDAIGCEAGPLPGLDETDYAVWTTSNGYQTGP